MSTHMSTYTNEEKHDAERMKARNWYFWLWLSPLLTIPTLLIVSNLFYSGELLIVSILFYSVELLSVLISSLWHLILLIPSFDKQSEFVRWHGRQMLILAGIRTAIPVLFVLYFNNPFVIWFSIPVLIVVWLVGNIWGQRQAVRGDCSLMRWTGREALLPGPEIAMKNNVIELVDVIRFSTDPLVRQRALNKLQKLGLVEEL